jgi:16S rRNA U1498 N3-methylase RsmE
MIKVRRIRARRTVELVNKSDQAIVAMVALSADTNLLVRETHEQISVALYLCFA